MVNMNDAPECALPTTKLTALTLHEFRNYTSKTIEFSAKTSVLTGNNGAGKTNILEAIYLLSALSSFRHPKLSELVRFHQEQASVEGNFECGDRRLAVALRVNPDSKSYTLNTKKKAISQLKGMLPAVVFSPSDLALVQNSSKLKRDALDVLGGQLSRSYYQVKRDFEKILSYKRSLLKQGCTREYLQATNETFALCSAHLSYQRCRLFKLLLPLIAQFYSHFSSGKEVCHARYTYSWQADSSSDGTSPTTSANLDTSELTVEELLSLTRQQLDLRAQVECLSARTIIGAHHDAITFYIDNVPVQQFASQGQARSLALSWKLAELELIETIKHIKPLLLLDDVMSELDSSRVAFLCSYLNKPYQSFITTTSMSDFDYSCLNDYQEICIEK